MGYLTIETRIPTHTLMQDVELSKALTLRERLLLEELKDETLVLEMEVLIEDYDILEYYAVNCEVLWENDGTHADLPTVSAERLNRMMCRKYKGVVAEILFKSSKDEWIDEWIDRDEDGDEAAEEEWHQWMRKHNMCDNEYEDGEYIHGYDL